MTTVQIKNNAQEAFNNKDYPKAFNTLWKLGVVGFLEFSQSEDRRTKKQNWLAINWKKQNTKGYRYFWDTFILQENVFSACFSSQRPVELLHNYFSKTIIFNEAFETKLAKEYPRIFVEAIRKNEVFFREDRIDFLLKEGLLVDEFVIHQDVWESFQSVELELWNQIESTIVIIEKYPLEHILFYTVGYFETKNYEAAFDLPNQTYLAEGYSFFIDLILRNPKVKQQGFSTEQFEKGFILTIFKNKDLELENAISKCLNLIMNRQGLNSSFFQTYCFNADFVPKYIYESLCFYESPESQYQWNVDEFRYKVNEEVYKEKGTLIVERQLENGMLIPGIDEAHYLNNKRLACNLQAVITVLNDLKLSHFNSKNVKVTPVAVIKPLYVYAFNRLVRYYEGLRNIQQSPPKSVNSWKTALLELVRTHRKGYQLPFVYTSKQEYFDLNIKADKEFDLATSNQVLNQFGLNRVGLKPFDRFNLKYAVIDTPFILLGDYIFSPVLFFTSFTSQNVYVKSLLQNDNRRTASDIENVLEDLLVAHGLEIKHPSNKEVSLINGDADLIVSDDNNVLLIQLKRTSLRLDYKAQYYEHIHTDLKAANQLNNAEQYFTTENPVFDLKNRKVTKWIVSNSFEKVNTEINNCLKVNYLDLVNVLSNTEGMTFKTLPDFISFFEEDTYFNSIAKELIEGNTMFKGLFSISNTKHRNFSWKHFDEVKATKYRHYYDKGIELSEKGYHKNAIKSLNECLKLENEDFEVHGVIANVYADLKNYKKAFFHYEKALEIVPNEPLVLKNYAYTLAESGDQKGVDLANQMINNYPFLSLM